MATFMVTIVFVATTTPDKILPLLEAEQKQFKWLMEQGSIETAFLTPDRKRGWMVMKGLNEAEVDGLVKTLPLYPYMQVEIFELGN